MPMRDLLHNFAWRFGRKLYCWARGDLPNDPNSNGEYWLLERLLQGMDSGGVLLDVGANKGDWSLRALEIAERTRKEVRLSSFEPCSATREILTARLPLSAHVEVFPFALSNTEGEADFFSSGAGVGTNSMSAESGPMAERVQLMTLDVFLDHQGIDRVSMVKVDTEGFDLSVLEGAAKSIASGRIEVVQFEYNWRWLLNKASLLDVFNLIDGMPYRLGKLSGESIVFFDKWHFELDRYFENNYVLVLKGSATERLGQHVRFDAGNVAVRVGTA